MDSARVRGILQAVQEHRDASVSPEERDVLVSQGFLGVVDLATRDRWTASVSDLPSLRDRVREMSRVALATPGPEAPPELRQMIADLEQATRAKASLESVAWNAPTQQFLLPTLAGRNLLADLTTWERRLEGRTFEDFQEEMSMYREVLAHTTGRAEAVYRGLLLDEGTQDVEMVPTELLFTNVDFRFASMILAKRSVDPSLLVRSFQFFNHETNWGSLNKDDRLIGSAILASLPWDLGSVRQNFERIRIALASHGILPEDRIIVAASLTDLPENWWTQVLARIDEIRRARPPLNSLLASTLARSPYPLAEALGRFDGALAGMAAKGHKDGIHLEAAAAILAAAQIPADDMVDRFALTVSHVAGTFNPPYAPAAMLAASPLEPLEAIDVFRDCLGTVTRNNFFDLTLEIEELALIMSYGVAPLGLGYMAANLPPGAPIVPAPPVAAMAPVWGTSWYVWHNYWVYRPIGRYIATHPVHVHTVAAFG